MGGGLTIGYGALMTALGVGGFVATGRQSKTALIPVGFGAAAIGLGLLAGRKGAARGALGAAAALSALAVAGSARGLAKLPKLARGEEVERPEAAIAQSIMAGLSAVHAGICLQALLSK
ncbi:hypothetical protein E8A73_039145 [Polyangium aurulentum]|nr:hypothetical protein E8A73_039145 [Polyangium aurulentum]